MYFEGLCYYFQSLLYFSFFGPSSHTVSRRARQVRLYVELRVPIWSRISGIVGPAEGPVHPLPMERLFALQGHAVLLAYQVGRIVTETGQMAAKRILLRISGIVGPAEGPVHPLPMERLFAL
jgi:hypothetical protein